MNLEIAFINLEWIYPRSDIPWLFFPNCCYIPFVSIALIFFLLLIGEVFGDKPPDIRQTQSSENLKTPSTSSRTTHCFNCKCTLNSSVDNKCWWCGWLKCKCGGCGCNFKRY